MKKRETNNSFDSESETDELKLHIQDLINILKVENKKYENLKEEFNIILQVNSQLIDFSKKLLYILEPFLKTANPQLINDLNRNFVEIRAKLPKKFDPNFEEDENQVFAYFKIF